ncbi:neuronal membrane glycoprotein M6-a-like [Gordionus sp. m RMFG-2023]|uniref:neuronal membrane glycoprotein M6-a-like n=1 Tax=Gordionus sp. m RMFG-2023 TaxID=3053472 RepID=UPI0031FCABE6
MAFMKCMTRIPYATLIAFILCIIGVGLFCGTMWEAVSITLIQMETNFHIKLTTLDHIRTAFIVVASTMGTISILLLIVGFLATGATRETIYRGNKSRISGRVSIIFFMLVTYVLSLVWLLVLCLMTILCFTLGMFAGNCYANRKESTGVCLTLDPYKVFLGGKYDTRFNVQCGQSFLQFCKYTQDSLSLYIIAYVSTLLIVIGLIHYLMCLSANYAHIKDYKKMMEYEEAKYLEEQEMNSIVKSRF